MSKTRRVVFSFDERSLESLQKLTEQGRFSSIGILIGHFIFPLLLPNTDTIAGGTTITIAGTDFLGASAVNFGAIAGTGLSVISSNAAVL